MEHGAGSGHAFAYDDKQLPRDKTLIWSTMRTEDWQDFDSQPTELKKKVIDSINERGYYRCSKEDYQYIWVPVEPTEKVGSPKWNRYMWKIALGLFISSLIIFYIGLQFQGYGVEYPLIIVLIPGLIWMYSWVGILMGGILLIAIIGKIIINGIKHTFSDK